MFCVLIFTRGTFSKSDERASNGFETALLFLFIPSFVKSVSATLCLDDGVWLVCDLTSLYNVQSLSSERLSNPSNIVEMSGR